MSGHSLITFLISTHLQMQNFWQNISLLTHLLSLHTQPQVGFQQLFESSDMLILPKIFFNLDICYFPKIYLLSTNVDNYKWRIGFLYMKVCVRRTLSKTYMYTFFWQTNYDIYYWEKREQILDMFLAFFERMPYLKCDFCFNYNFKCIQKVHWN